MALFRQIDLTCGFKSAISGVACRKFYVGQVAVAPAQMVPMPLCSKD